MNHLNIIEKLAAAGHLSGEQVERIGRNVSDIMLAVDDQPGILKEAAIASGAASPGFWGKLWGGTKTLGGDTKQVFLKQVLPYSAAAAVGGTAFGYTQKAMDVAGKATIGRIGKARSFDKMMATHPDLKDRDPTKVRTHFNSLHHFSPEYAKDPLMAGEYVKQTMDVASINMTMPKTLVDVQKGLSGTPQQTSRLESYITSGQAPADIAAENARRQEAHKMLKTRDVHQRMLDVKKDRQAGEMHKAKMWEAAQAKADKPLSSMRAELANKRAIAGLSDAVTRSEQEAVAASKAVFDAARMKDADALEEARDRSDVAGKQVKYLRGILDKL